MLVDTVRYPFHLLLLAINVHVLTTSHDWSSLTDIFGFHAKSGTLYSSPEIFLTLERATNKAPVVIRSSLCVTGLATIYLFMLPANCNCNSFASMHGRCPTKTYRHLLPFAVMIDTINSSFNLKNRNNFRIFTMKRGPEYPR